MKPVLQALHTALVVYDAIEKNKIAVVKKRLHQIFDDVSEQLPMFNVDDKHTIITNLGNKRIEKTYSLPKMETVVREQINSEEEIFISEVREVVHRRKANAIKRQERIAKQYTSPRQARGSRRTLASVIGPAIRLHHVADTDHTSGRTWYVECRAWRVSHGPKDGFPRLAG